MLGEAWKKSKVVLERGINGLSNELHVSFICVGLKSKKLLKVKVDNLTNDRPPLRGEEGGGGYAHANLSPDLGKTYPLYFGPHNSG